MTAPSDGHVSWRRLVDRRDRRLSPARAAAADGHLGAGCEQCSESARAIERLVTAIADGRPQSPPRHAVDAAIRLYRDTQMAFTREAERVLGTLLLESDADLEAALRAPVAQTRRLLWRVGEFEVDASLVAGSRGADLLAQVVPGGDDPSAAVSGEVSLHGAGGRKWKAHVEPDGRFTFRGLAPGVYTVQGRVDSMRFVLPPIRVE